MNSVLLFVIAGSLGAVAVFLILLLIEAKKTVFSLRKTTEEKLNPALDELQLNLKNLRNISGDINDVTSDVKTLSRSIKDAGHAVHKVTNMVEDVGTTASIRVISVKTGVRVALEYLISNLFKKGEKT